MSDYLSPHFDTSALLLVDVQRDFVDGAMPVPGTKELLPRLARLAHGFRSAGRPIVHVIRLYTPGGSDVDIVRRAAVEAGTQIVAPGTLGANIPAELLPDGTQVTLDTPHLLRGAPQELSENEAILYKPRWSAFYRTVLAAWLGPRAIDTVVVAGCNLPNCPRATLFDASERDLRTALAIDSVSQATSARLADLELIGVNLLTTDQITGQLTHLVIGHPAATPVGHAHSGAPATST